MWYSYGDKFCTRNGYSILVIHIVIVSYNPNYYNKSRIFTFEISRIQNSKTNSNGMMLKMNNVKVNIKL